MTLFALGFTTGILLTIFAPKLYRAFVYPKTYEGITRKATDEACERAVTDQN